jgi:hypothetical protein
MLLLAKRLPGDVERYRLVPGPARKAVGPSRTLGAGALKGT